MRIAIIGGSGFIGTRLMDLLVNENIDVKIFDKRQSKKYPDKTIIADVRDKNSFTGKLKGFNLIINLAAEHKDNVFPVELYQQVNVDGAENICNIAAANGINKIIFTSSVAVYGNTKEETSEAGEINYFNEYGRTKYEAEKVYEKWQKQSPDRQLVVLRPAVVFGEGNRGNVYNLLRQIAGGKFLMVGKGINKKSMAYVDNVAAFIKHLVFFDCQYAVFNYVDKPDFDMNSLAAFVYKTLGKRYVGIRIPYILGIAGGLVFDILAKIMRREFSVSMIRIKKFCANSHFSSSAVESTGFKPLTGISEALLKTIKAEFIK
jgi:nucleoside-diphosphate-sugar epimerase